MPDTVLDFRPARSTKMDPVGFLGNPALVCVRADDGRVNLITITMKFLGDYLGDPAVGLILHESRYTRKLLAEASSFSLNQGPALAGAIEYCGRVSGRDVDKIAGSGLSLEPGRRIQTPSVAEASIYYECSIAGSVFQDTPEYPCEIFFGKIEGVFERVD